MRLTIWGQWPFGPELNGLATPRRPGTTGRDVVRFVAVAAISLFALASTLAALGVLGYPRASFGFGLDGRVVSVVGPGTPAADAGIEPGDELAASTPLATRLRLLWYDVYRPGAVERITFERAGLPRSVTLTAVQHPPPFNATDELLIVLRMLTYVVFITVGAALVLLRPARFTWAFFGCCVGLATFPAFIGWSLTWLDPLLGLAATVVWTCAADLANVGFLAFALRFPSDRATGWRRPAWRSLQFWLLAFLAIDAWTIVAWYTGANLPTAIVWSPDALGFAAWALGTTALFATYRAEGPRNRKRLQWAIAGSSLGYLAWYVGDLLVNHSHFPIAGRIVGFGTLALPLSIGYAVLRHRVVDVRFVVNRALAYSLLGSLLFALFVLTSWLTAVLLLQSHAQLLVQVSLALLIGVWLSRAHRRVERALEVALFRRLRHAEAELAQATAAMRSTGSREALDRLLAEIPASALGLDFAHVYRRNTRGDFTLAARIGEAPSVPTTLGRSDPLVAMVLANRQPGRCAGAVALLVGGTASHAIVLYGPHENGLDLDPDEVALLGKFVESAEPAYGSLEARSTTARKLVALIRRPETLVDEGFARELGALVLDGLSPEDRALLEACAAIPAATADEVALVVGGPAVRERLNELAATTPLVERSEQGRYAVHRLIATLLGERNATVARAQLVQCAAGHVASGAFLRASELYAAAGERGEALAAAARASRNGSGSAQLPATVDALLRSATIEERSRFPRLLILQARATLPVEDDAVLRKAVIEVLEHAPDVDVSTRAELRSWLAYAFAESGDAFEPLLERIRESGAEPDLALLRAHEGPWNLSALAEQTFRSWLGDDRQRCVAAAQELLESASRAGTHSLDHVAHNALGADTDPPRSSYPRFAAYSWVMQAARAADRREAPEKAWSAYRAAIKGRAPFVAVLACVVLSELEPGQRDDHLSRAASLKFELPDLKLDELLATYCAGVEPPELFEPLVRRVRASGAYAPPLGIEIASASVRRGSHALAVPEREVALLLALAASAQPLASATLIDRLWPDLDEVAGARALQTCVYRVRQRLAETNAIESVAQGYRLGSEVYVDLQNAERFVATQPPGAAADVFVRLRLEAVARHFGRSRPAVSLGWEWYDSLERRNAAVARAARLRLAEHHLECGEPPGALAFARAMIDADELDERGRELAIRAFVASGDVAEAWREMRLYREALARECAAEPPAALMALLPTLEDGRALA